MSYEWESKASKSSEYYLAMSTVNMSKSNIFICKKSNFYL